MGCTNCYNMMTKGNSLLEFADNYIVVDLETSGFSHSSDEIIEIGAIKVINNKVSETFQTLIKPIIPISSRITCLTGITNEMLRSAPNIDIVLNQFIDFAGDNILIGHNIAAFDINFLYTNISSVLDRTFTNDFIDTMRLSKKLFDFDNYKLQTLKNKFNIGECVEHRALSDCFDTLKCYQYMQSFCNNDSNMLSKTNYTHTAEKPNHKEKMFNVAYSDQTQSLQLLQGILLGITCDNILTEDEVFSLKQWLDTNTHLRGNYPYDRAFKSIEKALEDNILERYELEELLSIFKNLINPTRQIISNCECFKLQNKIVCVTGEFDTHPRQDVVKYLEDNGAIIKNTVVKNTDYLIVGGLGSCNWKCGNYGSKIKKAIELQDKGSNINIINECDFIKLVGEF